MKNPHSLRVQGFQHVQAKKLTEKASINCIQVCSIYLRTLICGLRSCAEERHRGGRPARSGPDWRQASKLLPSLAPEPEEVTVVIAAGRDE